MLSEFNFRATDDRCNEQALNAWMKTNLIRSSRSKYSDDCHLLSSFDYSHSCDFKVPYDHTHDGFAMLMRVRFNVTFDMSTKLGGLTHQVHPMHSLKCHAKVHNLTTASLDLIHNFWREDFDVYKQAQKDWGKLIEEGMVNPQLPDLCPQNAECTSKDTAASCPYSGCKVPWLDEELGKDWPCIKVGCDPRNHKRWSPH